MSTQKLASVYTEQLSPQAPKAACPSTCGWTAVVHLDSGSLTRAQKK